MTKRFLSILMIIAIVLLLIPVTPAEAQTVVSKTEEEVRAWLDSQVGRKVNNLDDDLYASYLSFWGLDWNTFENPPHITCPPGFVEININGNAENLRTGDIIVPDVYWRGGEPINVFWGKDQFGNDQYIRTDDGYPETHIEKVANALPQYIILCYRPTNIVCAQQSDEIEAYKAYLDILKKNKGGFYTSQIVYSKPVVALYDVWGDGIPELICQADNESYETISFDITTYHDGKTELLFEKILPWDYLADSFMFFTQKGSGKLCWLYYSKLIEDKWGEHEHAFYSIEDTESDTMGTESICWEGFDGDGWKYRVHHDNATKEQFNAVESDLINSISDVLIFTDEDIYISYSSDDADCFAMTYDEAIYWLERMINELADPHSQHTIKSDPNEDRDFTLNVGDEIEDLVFSTRSTEYNPRLAHFLSCMARSAYSLTQAEKNYDELGFFHKAYHYDYGDPFAAFLIGKKRLNDGRLIVMITIRGTSDDFTLVNNDGIYGNEWTDTNYSKDLIENEIEPSVGLHEGFYRCEVQLYGALLDYFHYRIPKKNVTFIITGHSLGAAVGNLISLKLFKKGVPTESVYNYNFACPLVGAGTDDASLWNYHGLHNNIINICNRFDVVPSMPNEVVYTLEDLLIYDSKGWTSFKRFGVSHWFDNGWAHFIDAHNMCAYIDYLARELDESHFISTEYYVDTFSVHCPVDVTVINSRGEPIAGTENNVPNYYGYEEGEKAFIIVDGDIKTFLITGEEKLEVRFRGTDEGEMDYAYCRRGLIGESTLVSKAFSSVKLTEGKELVSFVGAGATEDEIRLFVVENGKYTAEIQRDGTEKLLTNGIQTEPPSPIGSVTPTESFDPDNGNVNKKWTIVNSLLVFAIIASVIATLVVIIVSSKNKRK